MIPITEIPAALLRPQGCYRWEIPGPAPGKPRQTQSDKWKQRPAVVAYRAWADRARWCIACVPPPASIASITLKAYYVPPSSWSRARRLDALGMRKRTTPDPDNIAKALLDALWSQDAAVGDLTVQRFWGDRPRLEVEVWLE